MRLPASATGLLTLIVGLSPTTHGHAQTTSLRCHKAVASPAQRAAMFAPDLSFHRTERYFPTVPFFPFFFNDSGGTRVAIDLTDIAQIAVPSSSDSKKASWNRLVGIYDRIIEQWRGPNTAIRPSPMTALFYRVRDVDEEAMWRFLRSDGQAWRRNNLDGLATYGVTEQTPFKVVEYYAYYLRDLGLKGHAEDIEFVFVFMPEAPDLACGFQVVVGAGHLANTPNNVLARMPAEVTSQPTFGVVVELGGHASAPDRNLDGEFTFGEDINWGLEHVWGTRDLLAVAGSGFGGGYHAEMTLPRDGAQLRSRAWVEGGSAGYRLLPVETLRDAHAAIAKQDTVGLRVALSELAMGLGVGSLAGPLGPDQLERFALWNQDLEHGGGGHRIWEHPHFEGHPQLIFKHHVYRPSPRSTGLESAWTWNRMVIAGSEFTSGDRPSYRLGLRLPFPNVFHARIPGVLQFMVSPSRERFTAIVLYDASFAERATWFAGITYADRRSGLGPDGERRRVWLSGGLTSVLYLADQPRWYNLGGAVGGLRVRLGPTVPVSELGRGTATVGWTAMVDVR